MIRSINKIDDYHMEYSIQMTFRESWYDARLVYPNDQGKINYLTLTETDKVWMPDLFFKNEKTGHFHNIILPNTYIRIYPDGEILFSIRISLTMSCPMNLKLYPLDTQICHLIMASCYGWTTDDLIFQWTKESEPIQVPKNLHLPRFTLEHYETGGCNSKTNTGEYSCLIVNLIFKREFSYYLIQYYIPCCMLVIVSWVSFWLDPYAVSARVSLGVTTLLTMSTQNAGINQSLPPVSYTKAIDVWTGVCLTFVFGALLEFALVNYACRSDVHWQRYRQWEANRAPYEEAVASSSAGRSSTHHDMYASTDHNGHPNFPLNLLVSLALGKVSNLNNYTKYMKEQDDTEDPAFAMRSIASPYMDQGGMHLHSCEVHLSTQRRSNCCSLWLSKFPTRSKRIDVIARITFPIVFAMFNLAYWSAYLITDN
ncbi:unnamed protein product, partial [Meganyctiphanes norvegica]